jgi:hypothetical protein
MSAPPTTRELVPVTRSSTTITTPITTAHTSSVNGVLQGYVRKAPCLNAERTTQQCVGPPVVAARILFRGTTGQRDQATAVTNNAGFYRTQLPAGSYTVTIEGYKFNASNPGETRTVTVRPGVTTVQELDVDSGIR